MRWPHSWMDSLSRPPPPLHPPPPPHSFPPHGSEEARYHWLLHHSSRVYYSTSYSITNIIMVSAKPVWPVLYTLSTFCSIFCYMNAMILFSFPCCLHRLSSQYILLSGQNIFWYILCTHESQQYCLCITVICWQYCLLVLCTHESHNIVCWVLTYADSNVCWVQYIAMKYFTILCPWEPQYCLLTTDVCWQ